MLGTRHAKVNTCFHKLASLAIACLATLAINFIAVHVDAQTISKGTYTDYARAATGINLYGAPKDWPTMAEKSGYYVSDRPMPGGVVCFEGGAYGTDSTYGFVGVVVYYQDNGAYWNIGVRYAYPTDSETYYSHSSVNEYGFKVRKDDPKVHYLYRQGMNVRRADYYLRPEYAGYNVVYKEYALSADTKEVTVYSKNSYVKSYVEPGQVVRLLAKAEVGETLWVFIESPYYKGQVYVKTNHDGKEELRKYDAHAPEAYHMYYAQAYGDTVLDLGYADYSKLAGDTGEVTITIKKGTDPKRLLPLQTISLHLAGK